MSRIAIVFGLLLCAITLAGLIVSMQKMPSQFFPMMLGIPILFCGVVGLNPHRRRHSMQAAALISTIGMLAGGGNAFFTVIRSLHGMAINLIGLRIVAAAALLCLVFLLLSLNAFWREASESRRWHV
ncbi:hypothetical protein Q31b_30990 [Novipirellula aureliae]|uniref:Uncharacterized protein n=1 Tax=Novipirellula aureliae TaxID=2527966 RepID=A0A5C6DYX9_9BACT|nr:hypothetical protein [Novipirellula aureliae]TWU41645.1 hypothetical protein Q31b_30990 [Novipirellula aureliae]